jgi:hypothetical protein
MSACVCVLVCLCFCVSVLVCICLPARPSQTVMCEASVTVCLVMTIMYVCLSGVSACASVCLGLPLCASVFPLYVHLSPSLLCDVSVWMCICPCLRLSGHSVSRSVCLDAPVCQCFRFAAVPNHCVSFGRATPYFSGCTTHGAEHQR